MKRLAASGIVFLAWTGASVSADLAVPGDFATIQAAIDAAASGDTVIVAPGTYSENLTMRSGITVRGQEAARTWLEPQTAGATVVMSGITDATLANVTIVDSTVGVRVADSADLLITNVVIDAATDAAIEIDAFSTIEIRNSVFFENATAVRRLAGAPLIENNLFVGNANTLVSPVGLAGANVDFNGFFDNDDLRQGDVDTGIGTNFQVGAPRFVDPAVRDFHVQSGSIAIDTGTGLDVIDDTVADLGAYGGPEADARPFPVAGVTLATSAANPPPFALDVSWEPNLDYRITDGAIDGGYRVYYRQNAAGPPYPGSDAGGGTQPSPIEVDTGTEIRLDDLSPQIDATAAPRLLTASGRNESAALSWESVPGATGYRVFYGTADPGENTIDVGDRTSTTVTGLANGTAYQFAVAATRRPVYHVAVTAVDGTTARNESAFSAEQQIALGPLAVSNRSNTLTATPEVTVPVPDLPDKGCFIATAAYGADWQPQVAVLREFRDRYLASTPLGRVVVRWYYDHGPSAATYLTQHETLKPVVRALLSPVVFAALILVGSSPFEKVLLACLLIAWIPVRRRGLERLAGNDR